MKRRKLSIEQSDYLICKAAVDTLREAEQKIEQDYIKSHSIINPDGSIPSCSWMIEDDKTFENMMQDIENELNTLNLNEAETALKEAEDEIIRFGLRLMPKRYSKERSILEEACFGLNNQYVHIAIREKVIQLALNFDITTL